MVQDEKKTWTHDEDRQFVDGERDKLALRMMSELVISKNPVFQCSNILPSGVLMKRKQGKGCGTYFKHEPENHLTLVNMTLAYNQLCWFFAIGFTTRCQF